MRGVRGGVSGAWQAWRRGVRSANKVTAGRGLFRVSFAQIYVDSFNYTRAKQRSRQLLKILYNLTQKNSQSLLLGSQLQYFYLDSQFNVELIKH